MPSRKRAKPAAAASTTDLPLTREELEFLRDVFGLVTPVRSADGSEDLEGGVTGMLADVTGRQTVEAQLWDKIVSACERLGVVVGDEAPSYGVSAADVPVNHVYELER